VSELERLAAAELMSGTLDGNRDIYICAFELVGKEAFGKSQLLCKRMLQRETLLF
jgi:hypothetical protein